MTNFRNRIKFKINYINKSLIQILRSKMSKIPNNKYNNFSKKTISLNQQTLVKKPFIEKEKIEKLAQERILQKNVVYVIGLSYKLANREILQKKEYFGQYGSISKILTNKTKGLAQNSTNENCYSSYIYFTNSIEASLAILAVDNFKIENHYLKTSFGRTKYCSYFSRNLDCLNKDCFYLHKLADKNDIIHGDDSRLLFHEQHVQAIKIANLMDANFKKKILAEETKKNIESVFPKISSIFSKPVFLEFQNEINSNKINNSNDACKIGNDNNNNTVKLSLISILNGNKATNNSNIEDKKYANIEKEISEINSESVQTKDNKDNFLDNTIVQNSDKDVFLMEENGKIINKELEHLKLADILKNEKQIKHNSPGKIRIADALIKITPIEKKADSIINQNLNESEFNSCSNKYWINNKISINEEKNNFKVRDVANFTEPQKIVDSIFNDLITFKIQESNNLITNDTFADDLHESKEQLSKRSDYSEEEHNYKGKEREINNTRETILSYHPDDHSIKDLRIKTNRNPNMNIIGVNDIYYSDQDNNKGFIGVVNNNLSENKTLYKEIEKNYTVNNKNNKLKTNKETDFDENNNIEILDKDLSLINSEIKSDLQTLELPNSKSIQDLNSYIYSDIKGEEFLIKNIEEKKAVNDPIISKLYEINSSNNKINIVNTTKKFKENSKSKKDSKQILMDTAKSDPRSSLISTTSCSVSPNISYNQEIENQLNNNLINIYNKESKPFEIIEKKKSLYTKRDISRFNFVSNNVKFEEKGNYLSNIYIGFEKNDDEIPEFIFDVVNKKISRFSFFKRFKNEYNISDMIFLENKIIENYKDKSWADFIKNNMFP